MRFHKWFYSLLIIALIISACQTVVGEVHFQPQATPLVISINTRGEISLSIEHGVEIPTPIGIFGVGVVINPAEEFNVENTLTVRMNGQDHFYDLHGEDFNVSFESGYYRKINLQKKGLDILLELERIDDKQVQEQMALHEDPGKFINYYYGLINDRQYEQAWSLLSNDFISRNHNNDAGGYSAYVDWWNSISSVTVSSAESEYQGGNSAKVVTLLRYKKKNSCSYDDKVYFQLIYDQSRDTWLIDATPTDWNY